MNKLQPFALAIGAIALLPNYAAAQRDYRTHNSPTDPEGLMGTAVAAIGDIDGDLVTDYAVGGQRIDFAGVGAGAVQAFSGASGALLWTANGEGNWPVCGQVGTAGDGFGSDLEMVPDADGDGIDDLAVGSPLAGFPNGACRDPFAGSISVISSTTGVLIGTRLGTAAGDIYGRSIKRAPDMTFDGVDEYIVRAQNYFDIINGATSSVLLRIQLTSSGSMVCPAGDFNGDGLPWEVAISGAAGPSTVVILDVVNGTSTTFTGPSGSSFGGQLEFVPPSATTVGGILVGAPREASSTGAIYFVDRNGGNSRLALGTVIGGEFGSTIAYGGSADLDLAPNEALVGAPSAGYVSVVSLVGETVATINGPAPFSFGSSLAWIDASSTTGFNDFIVGDPEAFPGAGAARVYFGGPDATLDPSFGAGCHPQGGSVPLLTQDVGLSIGMPYTATITNAPAATTLALYLGIANSNGIPVASCTSWINPVPAPLLQSMGLTNVAGGWTSTGLSLPLDPNLAGLEVALQAVVLLPGGGLAFSNATSSVIGW